MKVETIQQVLFWIIVALLVIILTWRIFGSSPAIELAGLTLAGFGIVLGWESRINSKRASAEVGSKLDESDSKLEQISSGQKEQTQILKDIKKILEDKL